MNPSFVLRLSEYLVANIHLEAGCYLRHPLKRHVRSTMSPFLVICISYICLRLKRTCAPTGYMPEIETRPAYGEARGNLDVLLATLPGVLTPLRMKR